MGKINQSELHYNILKECVENNKITAGEIAEKLDLTSAYDISIVTLEDLKFIKRTGDLIELLPQGYSTYLSISSQKQSNEQAQKATKYAVWALGISIASFLASIFFSILSYLK